MQTPNSILTNLNYEIAPNGSGTRVKFIHPQLGGFLFLETSSHALAEVLVNHINLENTPKEESDDPLVQFLDSLNNLRSGVNNLKIAIGK